MSLAVRYGMPLGNQVVGLPAVRAAIAFSMRPAATRVSWLLSIVAERWIPPSFHFRFCYPVLPYLLLLSFALP